MPPADATATATLARLPVDALAAHRISRLITTDRVLAGPRARVLASDRLRRHPQLLYLLTCDHCLTVHISAALALLPPPPPPPPARSAHGGRFLAMLHTARYALAVAGAAGALREALDR